MSQNLHAILQVTLLNEEIKLTSDCMDNKNVDDDDCTK